MVGVTTTVLTDEQIVSCICGVYESTDAKEIGRLRLSSSAIPIGRAIEQAVLQSPEVQRLRKIELAAKGVLDWTESAHRPPVREDIPVGKSASVRVKALADLHDAIKENQ